MVAQSFSSAGNFALTVGLARSLDSTQFGGLAIILAGYAVVSGLLRGGLLEPQLAEADDSMRLWLIGLCRWFFLVVVLGGAVAALMERGGPSTLLVAFVGVALSFDVSKYESIRHARWERITIAEAVWAFPVAITAGLAILEVWCPSAELLVVMWGVGALAALLIVGPLPPGPWVCRRGRSGAGSLLRVVGSSLEFVSAAGVSHLAVLTVGFVAGQPQAGATRLAQTLLAPLTVVVAGLRPLLARSGSRSVEGSYAVAVLTIGLSLPVLYLFMPGEALGRLIGSGASAARELMLPSLVGVVALALANVPSIRLRSVGSIGRVLVVRGTAAITAIFVLAWVASGASVKWALWAYALILVVPLLILRRLAGAQDGE